VLFVVIALIGGRLAGRLRRQISALTTAQQQSQALLEFGRRLGSAPDLATLRREITLAISEYLDTPVVLVAPSGTTLSQVAASRDTLQLEPKELAAAQWAFEHRQSSGFGTDTLTALDWRFLPLAFEQDCFGVVAIGMGMRLSELGPLTREQLSTTEALVNSATQVIARVNLGLNLEQAKIAEETARLRSTLLSSVSHDLRTPLASMIGAATSLRSLHPDLSAKDREELLDAIIVEGERLNRYIQNLLDMTRLGHGNLKLTREWIDVEEIIDSALRRAPDLFHHARVEKSIAPALPSLYVHPALIEQALFNVLENAAKFSPDDGVIRIAARRDEGEILITVSDQGPGIAPDMREKVFDMFTVGGEGDRSKYGSGLGLAICRSMIGAHGGRVEALEGPGGIGATIAIHLPLVDAAADAATERRA
jgi:two-component system sensor histidine kinase KdpD